MTKSKNDLPRRDVLKTGFVAMAGLASHGLWAEDAAPRGQPPMSSTQAQNLSWEQQVDLRRLQPVRSMTNGVPVYSFGDTFIYGVSPDLAEGSVLQEGNHAKPRKIQPRKSWEISTNRLGATSPRVPRSEINDYQPFLGVHLIDGDAETCWMSRGQNQPDVEPVWARIDLARESQVGKIVLLPRADNKGLPIDITVQVSRDAWHWETVYSDQNFSVSHIGGPKVISFSPRQVKQVMVKASRCTEVAIPDQYNQPTWTFDFCLSLAGIEVIDDKNANVALVARGAGVTVSSTTRGFADEKLLHDQLWPVHYDLGLKWVRVAYWDSVLNWLYVEQDKGILRIDPWTDRVITECHRNGVDIVLCLAYGNWNYTPEGRRPHPKQIFETPWEMAPPPTTPEMLDGYKKFVRFMVRHFRDRVRYFEIWNEPDGKYAWGNKPNAKEYAQLVKEIAPIIRSEAPESKIVMAAVGFRPGKGSDYLKSCLDEGVAKLVDVMTIHPYYGTPQQSQDYLDYPDYIHNWKSLVESHGFRGEYMASESGWYAPYPKPVHPFANQPSLSEIVKAKYLAKYMVTNTGLSMTAFWNETWQDQFTYWDGSLMRSTFSADPVCPLQPQPAYYVMRTLSTVLEGAEPEKMTLEFRGVKKQLTSFSFRLPDGSRLAAMWLPGAGSDDAPDLPMDLVVTDANYTQAIGIDLLNGTEQALEIRSEEGSSVMRGLKVKDYPVLIRFK
jgi:hypothetical protein